MRRRSCLAGTVLFASCVGANVQPAPGSNLGRSAPVLAAAPAAGAPTAAASVPPAAVATTDAAELERHWRNQLATAADPVPAALELAALLAGLERHGDALVAIDSVLPRTGAAQLRVVRAGLQRDLGQRHLAVAELRAVVAAEGPAAVHPGLLFELAELEWLEGDARAAAATLQTLANEPANADWCREHGAARQALADEINSGRGPAKVRVRDLLGNLRGAPLATTRIAVLERLVAGDGVAGPDAQRLREAAIAIAVGDESAAVRARAVSLVPAGTDFAPDLVAAALGDEAALVRRAAAGRAAVLLGEGARDLLLQRLAVEDDEAAFAALDRALAGLVPDPVPLGPGEAMTPVARAQVVARWRARWPTAP